MPQLFALDKPETWPFRLTLSPFIPKGYVYSISNTIWANRESWEEMVGSEDTRKAFTDGLAAISHGLSPDCLDRRGEQRENFAAAGRRTWDPSEGGDELRAEQEDRQALASLESMLHDEWKRFRG